MEAIFKSVKDNVMWSIISCLIYFWVIVSIFQVSVMIFGTGARKLVEIFRKASEKALRPPNLYVFEENQWKAQDILTFTNGCSFQQLFDIDDKINVFYSAQFQR